MYLVMERNWSIIALACCLLMCNINLLHAADNTTQKAVPLGDTNSTSVAPATTKPTTATTTPKPKIKIADSDLCKKKCKCDIEYLQIDCSGKGLTSVFSTEDWQALQNGDVLFETIKLTNNNITNVTAFPEYPVKYLYLGFNQIDDIAIGAFKNLDNLTKLDLSHNKLSLKTLVPHVFEGKYVEDKYEPLPNLVELDLAHNDLHSLHDDLFEHTPNLETLILCQNTFQVIDTQTLVAIASLASLKTLDMSYTEISNLPETIFHTPKELETLLLSGNLFHKIPDALKLAKNLKKLVLDDNPFGDFKEGNFTDAQKSLQYLSISFLPETTRIGARALNVFENLTTLILSDNPRLESIHPLAFSKNTKNPDIFDYPPLEEIFLNNNNLTQLEHDWILRWDKVKTIDLRFNPWACDCTNGYLIHSLMKEINTTSEKLAQDVKCGSPAAWKGKPLLQLTADNKELICENTSHPAKDGLILIGILVGVLIGIPLTLGALVLYRRGCFGILNRVSPGAPRYNRASFADDFHI